ncbi:MAG: peptide-binding protein [bacterium]
MNVLKTQTKYFELLICLVCVVPLMITSCKEKRGNLTAGREVINEDPRSGGTYIEASIGDATYLNPILATDSASGDINSLVYNGLVRYNKDLILEGELAEKWEIRKNGLEIIFYLRKGVRWHDGEEFTARDVEFTYKKLIDPDVKTPYGSDYMLVKSFRVLTPYTIKITYKEPFSPALESWGMGIIPEHVFLNGDFNNNPANRSPVGTGPYKFVEWKTDQKIVLTANNDYFEGAPFIQKYIYRIIPDQSVQFLLLRNESIDGMELIPDQYKAYDDFFEKYNKYRYPRFAYVYMGFNLLKPLFKDKMIRKAIAYAVNKDEIIEGVLLGIGQPATGPFPPSSWAYNNNVKSLPYDPDKAKEILKQLGWSDTDSDGWLDKNGARFEFELITNQGNKVRGLITEIIQSHLKKIGIKVNIKIIEWSSFIHNFVNKKIFDAIVLGWSTALDPDQYALWHSSQMSEGKYNFVSFSNKEIDYLLEKGRRTFDLDKRKKIYHRIHEIIADEQPYIFLYYPDSLPVVHKRFRGVEVAPIGIGWNFRKWWVNINDRRFKIN